MNCPGHAELFAHRPRSYRELPLRLAEFGNVHRAEQTGEINGLLRARSFVIDDGHMFCRPEQVPAELIGCLAMARRVWELFDLEPHAELSLRPTNRLGSGELWDRAESELRDALHAAGLPFAECAGEGAFYGPKIDLHVSDALGRAWQLDSVQLDFQLPLRFELSYVNEAGETEMPVMIHRALLGSFERFIGVLIGHFDGVFPLWLAPEAIRVLPVGAEQAAYGHGLAGRLCAVGARAEWTATGRWVGASAARTTCACRWSRSSAPAKRTQVRSRCGRTDNVRALLGVRTLWSHARRDDRRASVGGALSLAAWLTHPSPPPPERCAGRSPFRTPVSVDAQHPSTRLADSWPPATRWC